MTGMLRGFMVIRLQPCMKLVPPPPPLPTLVLRVTVDYTQDSTLPEIKIRETNVFKIKRWHTQREGWRGIGRRLPPLPVGKKIGLARKAHILYFACHAYGSPDKKKTRTHTRPKRFLSLPSSQKNTKNNKRRATTSGTSTFTTKNDLRIIRTAVVRIVSYLYERT